MSIHVLGANLIESVNPIEGLTASDYGVTIVGNNFDGSETYFVKWGTVYSPRVTKTSPTTLVAWPPLNQVPTPDITLWVSLNDQNWIDSCQIVVGEANSLDLTNVGTSDHLTNVGVCSKFEFKGLHVHVCVAIVHDTCALQRIPFATHVNHQTNQLPLEQQHPSRQV